MADEIANKRPRADVEAALAEPALASLARAGAPVVVAEGDPLHVIHANESALSLFGAADCDALTRRLFDPGLPGGRALADLARRLQPGAPARLERLSFSGEAFPGAVTLLCRRTATETPLVVLAALGLRAGRTGARSAPQAVTAPEPSIPSPSIPSPSIPGPSIPGPAIPAAVLPPAAAPAVEAVEPAALAALRSRLEERFPGLAPARFLWRTDSRNVVVDVTPPLAEIVGPGCADLVGRDLVEASQALGLDPRGELAEALRAQVTFSHVDLDWPIDQTSAAAPVTLGALPVFDHGAHFEGWRGFGVIHIDRLHEGPMVAGLPGLAGAVPPEAPAPFRDDLAAAEPSPQDASQDLPKEPASRAPAPLEFSGVVVPLRPFSQARPAACAEPVEPVAGAATSSKTARDEAGDESALVALSPHERSAFREIAMALGARGTLIPGQGASGEDSSESTGAKPVASETAASCEPLSPPTPTSSSDAPPAPESRATTGKSEFNHRPLDERLLDALPTGVIVSRDGDPLYANRLALDWLAFPDLAAFRAAGGLRAASRFAAADIAPGQKRTLLLRAATGGAFSADAHCEQVEWDAAPADLLTLIRPSASALEQRIGVVEASLRQRESEIDDVQSMLDAAADGVVLINADGAILGLDRAAEALLGYDRNQVAGQNFTLLLARESHVSALDYFARAKAGTETHGREAIGRTREGATLPLHLTAGRLGKAIEGKYCLILRDMSHWRRTERSMEEARAQAERDSQAKSEFLAKVSHEIRTPLNAILGFAEVIMDERFGPVGNERYKEYLRDIHASGAHVMSLVNDLLDLSKIEAGKLDLTIAPVDANRVVSECVSIMQPQANREKVITRLALAARLPAIHADERSLRQIVLNLLANAVRYNEPGGQVIVSTALSDSGHAVLRVKDTGIGMSESELGAAMEPYGQVAPSRPGGAGLGLPLTKALAEANGASFSIKSRKSEGTLVEVVFALAPGASEQVSAGGATR